MTEFAQNCASPPVPISPPLESEAGDIEGMDPIRVMVVDDEPEIVSEISDYLRAKGMICDVASDAWEAIRLIEAQPAIGVVLTDIRMPKMDGLSLIRHLHRTLPERDLATIILTGHAGRNEAIEAIQAGALDFLSKPISLKLLVHSVQRGIDSIHARRTERAHKVGLETALAQERRLNQLQREFISMVSHEFRTPLAIIDGAAQRIIRRGYRYSTEEVAERLQRIRSAVARLVGLIDSTLSATRLDEGRIAFHARPCDVAAVVSTVIERQKEIAPDFEFDLDLRGLPPVILGDPERLDQVFTNLLSNAVKYSGSSRRIEIQGRREGNDALVSVRDHGIGIPEADLPRLFQRYFRAGTATGIPGTGIGLDIVKRLVEMHGGRITLASAEGVGTVFTISLPIERVGSDSSQALTLPPNS